MKQRSKPRTDVEHVDVGKGVEGLAAEDVTHGEEEIVLGHVNPVRIVG